MGWRGRSEVFAAATVRIIGDRPQVRRGALDFGIGVISYAPIVHSLASEVAHPFSLAFALDHRTWLHQYRREVTETREGAEADVRFSSEQGLQMFMAHGALLHGWALAGEGDGAAGIVMMRQGLELHASTGVIVSRPYWLYLLAWARGHNGDTEDGLRLLDKASTFIRDQHLWDAELHRLRGEFLLLTGAPRA